MLHFTYANITEADGVLVMDDETDDERGCPLLDVRIDRIAAVHRIRDVFDLHLEPGLTIRLEAADDEAYTQASNLLPLILRPKP